MMSPAVCLLKINLHLLCGSMVLIFQVRGEKCVRVSQEVSWPVLNRVVTQLLPS